MSISKRAAQDLIWGDLTKKLNGVQVNCHKEFPKRWLNFWP